MTSTLLRRRMTRRQSDEDRGSLALALLAIVVGMMIGALLLPMIITQSRATRFDISRVHALHAAQTGIDVLVGEIRASRTTDANGNVFGSDAGLPCGPLTGSANGTGSGTYSVSVVYWASQPTVGGLPMLCTPGYGTFDQTTKLPTPRYAVITSRGTDGAAINGNSNGRTLVTTYAFQTDDTNIPGGVIQIYPDSTGNQWCMDAGSAVPSVGTQVVLRTCSTSTPPAPQQVFAYRSDLSIQLVSSITSINPNGLCIDTNPTAHAASGVTMVLNTCSVVNPAKCTDITRCSPPNQQWSVDDNAHLRGALSDGSSTDSYCINAPAQTDGIGLTLASCGGGVTDTSQTWVPASTAGAGMAGTTNNQLVNYKQFATCLDVTAQDPNTSFLILYTCKQNPSPANVLWNQKFTPSPSPTGAPTQVLFKTTTGGSTYCLMSPLVAGGYVRVVKACPADASAPTAYQWTMYQTQDANGKDLSYAQKYTIVDSTGHLCLSLGQSSDKWAGQYIKAVVSNCDGSTSQKWNANASLDVSKFQNTHEN